MKEKALMEAIGANIKDIRMNKGMMQQDLAASCNFEKSNMCRIESGKTNLTLETLYKISKALKVPMRVLVDVERFLSDD